METFRIKWLTRIVYSQTFELCIAGIIFLNAVALALLTIPGIDAATRESLERFDQRLFQSEQESWRSERRGSLPVAIPFVTTA